MELPIWLIQIMVILSGVGIITVGMIVYFFVTTLKELKQLTKC